ncbi:hypothetical protein LY78DRAFT_672441 [Colletotrichum sublineola]|nr:hypothetical protein LY78DRAFT_672441 [Colletotrichum sublineola]
MAQLWILGDYFLISRLCEDVELYLDRWLDDWLAAGRLVYSSFDKANSDHILKRAFLSITLDPKPVRQKITLSTEFKTLCQEHCEFGNECMIKLIDEGDAHELMEETPMEDRDATLSHQEPVTPVKPDFGGDMADFDRTHFHKDFDDSQFDRRPFELQLDLPIYRRYYIPVLQVGDTPVRHALLMDMDNEIQNESPESDAMG